MMNLIYLFKLDERTKKVILVFCALFILLLLLFGAIYLAISKYMEKQSRKVDEYMYDLCVYKIVKSPKEFKKAVNYYEQRHLFNHAKWSIRCLILFTGLVFLITYFFFESDFKMIFTKIGELFPTVTFQTVGQVNETLKDIEGATLIPGPSWMPISILPTIISKNPDFGDISLYISTIYYVLAFLCLFRIFLAIITYIACMDRGHNMAKEVFKKKLDSLNMIDEMAKQFNQPVLPVQPQQQEVGEQL